MVLIRRSEDIEDELIDELLENIDAVEKYAGGCSSCTCVQRCPTGKSLQKSSPASPISTTTTNYSSSTSSSTRNSPSISLRYEESASVESEDGQHQPVPLKTTPCPFRNPDPALVGASSFSELIALSEEGNSHYSHEKEEETSEDSLMGDFGGYYEGGFEEEDEGVEDYEEAEDREGLQPILKKRRKSRRYFLPRIIKQDLRRKLSEMLSNVVNSYHYELMTTFFQKFLTPTAKMIKIPPVPSKPQAELWGRDLITYYFLILNQSSPDKILRLSETQIRTRTDTSDSEIVSRLQIKHTQVYEICAGRVAAELLKHHQHRLPTAFLSSAAASSSTSSSSSSSSSLSSSQGKSRKRKTMTSVAATETSRWTPGLDRGLFDPISGVFCKSRFPLAEHPQSYENEGICTLIVNHRREITKIIFAPLPDTYSDIPCTY